MKYILILTIKIYWFVVPATRRKKCIFRLSCSKYVYQETITKGLLGGLRALIFRFSNCRDGFEVVENHLGEIQIILPNFKILNQEEIAERFL